MAPGARLASEGQEATGVRNEIIALGIKYGLLSRETSFVAIERRETPVIGDVKLRKVPIALTTGWGGMQDVMLAAKASIHAGTIALGTPSTGSWMCGDADYSYQRHDSCIASGPHEESRAYHDEESIAQQQPAFRTLWRKPAAPAGMEALIVLQAADGSWELTSKLASIVGRGLDEVRGAVAGATGSRDEIVRAWATALAVVWLRERAAGVEDEWRMLVAKAQKWIDNTRAVPPGGGTWLDAARAFLP